MFTFTGHKQRTTPLWTTTVREIRAWLQCNPTLSADAALLPNRDGNAMTRCNVTQRLNIAVARAAEVNPGLAKRTISPHTVRHSTAMHLLQSGVAFSVIPLAWPREYDYDAPLRRGEPRDEVKAPASIQEPDTKLNRYQPPDDLMKFLQAL